MIWLFIICAAIAAVFLATLFYGAPFLPTKPSRVNDALDLLDLKPGQTLLELGSGDGRMLRAAARRGINAIGYELNPLLVIWTKLLSWRYRRLVTVRYQNYWLQPLSPADGIYVFLLQPYMRKLEAKIEHDFDGPVKLVSFAFFIPDKLPTEDRDGMLRYDFVPSTDRGR